MVASGCKCNKTCKIDDYLDIKNCSCKKFLIGKLVLERADEILETTETSFDDKKSNIWKKLLSYSHNFIISNMLVMISCHLC